MKKKILALSCMAIALTFGNKAMADVGGIADAQATATILSAVSVSKNSETITSGDLAFGGIIPDATEDGTVVIDPLTRVRTNDSGSLTLGGGSYGEASFKVNGSPYQYVTITLPSQSIEIVKSGDDSKKMVVDNWTCTNVGNIQLDNDGAGSFGVGGKLYVKGGQSAGVYSGTFSVTVAYQ